MKIVWNDILKERVDAVVTPASRNPQIGTGLDRIVHRAAGPRLLAARKALGRIEPGKIGVTEAFGVAKATGAKWIIHALGPVWNKKSGRRDELVLDGCYLRILCKAVELGCSSIALPVLSSGKFGMPMSKAIDIAVKAIGDFAAAFPKLDVRLVGIDADFYEYARKHYPDLTTAKITPEVERAYRKAVGGREDDITSLDDAFAMGDEGDYFDAQLLEELTGDGSFKDMFRRLWEYTMRREKATRAAKRKKHRVIEDDEFICSRQQLAVASGISETAIKHFCSSGDSRYRTTRDKIIALSVAMKLPPAYARRFLSTCGFTLGNTKRDKVISTHLEKRHGSYAILERELLKANLDPLDVGD